MSVLIDQFHFLRPVWLVVIPAALLLWFFVQRREDVRNRWKGVVAPHLLDVLLVGDSSGWRFRPIHLVVLVIIISSLGMSGPTWKLELPPFAEDRAPLAVVLDLSQSMDAIDVQPSRLERAKQKIRDLLKLRAGARTSLFVYAGSAHMVLPLTDDPSLMELFLTSLSTDLMPEGGKNATAALEAAAALLEREETPGTILFVTDGIEERDIPAFSRHSEENRDQILVLAVGTAQGGPVRVAEDRFLTDSSGNRITARLDVERFKRLNREAGVQITSVTLDSSDVEWVQNRAQSHLQQVQQEEAEQRWIDYGYFLTIPVVVLVALWFRRGWTIRWVPSTSLLLVFWLPASPLALEFRWLDLFLTQDQQGRYAFENDDFETASERFTDPLWKGISLYRSGNFEEAINQFALIETAEAYFYLGNCYARVNSFPAALESYQKAQDLRPEFPEAEENYRLVNSLLEQDKEEEEETGSPSEPNLDPDEVQFDERGEKGKPGEIDEALLSEEQQAEMWMRNIQTSPADYLRFKFLIQSDSGREFQ